MINVGNNLFAFSDVERYSCSKAPFSDISSSAISSDAILTFVVVDFSSKELFLPSVAS